MTEPEKAHFESNGGEFVPENALNAINQSNSSLDTSNDINPGN